MLIIVGSGSSGAAVVACTAKASGGDHLALVVLLAENFERLCTARGDTIVSTAKYYRKSVGRTGAGGVRGGQRGDARVLGERLRSCVKTKSQKDDY